MAKPKKQLREEEIARIQNQIKVHQVIKETKSAEYDKAMNTQDEEIEILEVKLDAIKLLDETEKPKEEAEEKAKLMTTLAELKVSTAGLEKKSIEELQKMVVDTRAKIAEKLSNPK